VYSWLRDLVAVPADVETVARELGLRGFEVASVETGDEPVIDFEITANRPDCLSHLGLAREAAATWGLPVQMPGMAGRHRDRPRHSMSRSKTPSSARATARRSSR
jgi:phenylalanyl-tRNA synthetase beta subunit